MMNVLKSVVCCSTLIACSLLGCKEGRSEPHTDEFLSNQPNIILILADDFGIMDAQSYAHHFTEADTSSMFYETPNINKLMAQGTSFSQAYANPLCSPTRASLLTGLYAARLGFTTAMPHRKTYYNQDSKVPHGFYIHDVLEHRDDIKIEQALVNATSNSALPTGTETDNGYDAVSIAEALPKYHSAFIGKWHIGGFGAEGHQPKENGFETLAYFDGGASSYFNWRNVWNDTSKHVFPKIPQEKWEIGNAGEFTNEKYLTDDLTAQALNFIDTRLNSQNQPFFLYLSHFAVHSPYEAKPEDVNYFESKSTLGWNNHKDPVYASMVKSIDASVGAIMKKLENTGFDNNTLVIFMSDNGGIDSKLTPRGDGTDNAPFLGGKATLNEGGIRVPLVFWWKGKVAANKWIDTPVDCTDIFPTLLEVAGMEEARSEDLELDGQSLWPLFDSIQFSSESYSKTTHFWHYPFNVIYNSPYDHLPLTPHSAIRDGDFKLIFDWHGRLHLYNIAEDPFESNDLASQWPEKAKHLHAKLMVWLRDKVEPRYYPSINDNYNESNELRDQPFKDLFSAYLKTND